MTRLEKIKSMDARELSRYLCDRTDDCSECMAKEHCKLHHNGYLTWLEEEWDDERQKE